MNRGDTLCLLLDYKLNGESLVEDAYQEIELQINNERGNKGLKKLYSKGEIKWGTVLKETGEPFTGYYTNLDQSETFNLVAGPSQCQLRIKVNDEVGSSAESSFSLGSVLSSKVI